MLQVIGWCTVAANVAAFWYMVSRGLLFGTFLSIGVICGLVYVLASDRA